MPLTVQPQFGSFVYSTQNCDVEEWRDQLEVGARVVTPARGDRSAAIDAYLQPRVVSLSGMIMNSTWSTRDQLRDAVSAFAYAHGPGHKALYRDTDRYVTAQVRSLTLGEDVGLLACPWRCEFLAADPYWYSSTESSDTWASPLSGTTRSVTTAGLATSPPKLTVTVGAAGGTLNLTMVNAGKSWNFQGTVSAGDVIIIDHSAETVTRAGSSVMSLWSGTFWTLAPGANTLEITYSGPSIASVVTAWRDRWL